MLYNDAYGADIKYVIVQKFDDDDLAAFVDILEDGVFRFKVNVTLYSSNNELEKITGWLEKSKLCRVLCVLTLMKTGTQYYMCIRPRCRFRLHFCQSPCRF